MKLLTEVMRFVRLGFWKKFVIGIIVVWSFTAFVKIPILVVKLAALVVFTVSSILIMPNVISQFFSAIRVLRLHSQRTIRPKPDYFIELQNRMGVSLKEFATLPGKIAYTKGKCIVLGEEVLRDLDFCGIVGVFAHELAHIRGRHLLIRSIAAAILLLVPIYGWWAITMPIFWSEFLTNIIVQVMLAIALIVFIIIAMIPVNWKLEERADRVAKEFVGRHAMESALLNIRDEDEYDVLSETHPSISERIRLLRKMDDSVENVNLLRKLRRLFKRSR